MADNVLINAANNQTATVATEEINSAQVELIKPIWGDKGVANRITAATPLPTTANLAALTSHGTGRATITSPGTRVQLPANTCGCVIVKASAANAGTIYFGNNTVTAATGFELLAGDSIAVDITNTNLIWLDASTAGSIVTFWWGAP